MSVADTTIIKNLGYSGVAAAPEIVGEHPTTPIEAFFVGKPRALEIYEREEDTAHQDRGRLDAKILNVQGQATALGELRVELGHYQRIMDDDLPDKRAKTLKRLQARIDRQLESLQKAQAIRPHQHSAIHVCDPWIMFEGRSAKWQDAPPVEDTLLPGLSPLEMLNEHYRNEIAKNVADINIVNKSPPTAAMIEAAIRRSVRQYGKDVDAKTARTIRRKLSRGGPDTFTQGEITMPLAHLRTGESFPDVAAALWKLFESEITEKLLAQAMAGYDDSQAMDMTARRDALAELHAERLRLSRLAEFWYQACRADGLDIQRISMDPVAILNVEPA